MRCVLSFLTVAGLFGCAHQSVEVNITAATNLEKPGGASANPRIGFTSRGTVVGGTIVIQLTREAFQNKLKLDEQVVARNRALEPTALLKIVEIAGMAAQLMIIRGLPGPEDEVVLPSKKLRDAAEALPLIKTDT